MYEKKEVMNKDLAKFTVRLKNCVDVDQVDTGSKKVFAFRVVQDKGGAFEFHAPTAEDRRTWCDIVREEWLSRVAESETSPVLAVLPEQPGHTTPPGVPSSPSDGLNTAGPARLGVGESADDALAGDDMGESSQHARGELTVTAGMTRKVIRQGWLQKQTSGWTKSWVKHWASLSQGTSSLSAQLLLYDNAQVRISCVPQSNADRVSERESPSKVAPVSESPEVSLTNLMMI